MNSDIFYKSPEGVAENFIDQYVNAKDVSDFAGLAESLALTDEQAKAVWDFMIKGAARVCNEINACSDAYYADVEKFFNNRYGAGAAQKGREIAALIKEFGGQEFADFLVGSGLGNRRETVTFFANLIDALGEDDALAGEKGVPVASSAALNDEIARLMAHPAYMQSKHPEHDAYVQKVFGLRKRLFNED